MGKKGGKKKKEEGELTIAYTCRREMLLRPLEVFPYENW